MAIDVIGEAFRQVEDDITVTGEIESSSKSRAFEPNLALIDYADGIWGSDSFTSVCAAIKDRYVRTNQRLEKFTSADILACIKFENNDDDDSKRKQKKNRRVRFSTGMSISVDSLVQCNSDHQADSKEDGEQNESTNANRQFLEKDFVNVSPHRHLATGENKIYSAYLEDLKTVGYGRRCLNLYPRYNNSFDPRLIFCGLFGDLNTKTPVTEFGDNKHTDTFNCALTLHDPAGFTNLYLNTYRIYLKGLDTAVCVPKKEDREAEESESGINLHDAEDITEEENRLREKLESIKYLWPSYQKSHSPSKVLKDTMRRIPDDSGGIVFNRERNADGKSIPLYGLSVCYNVADNVDASPIKADEKLIVHTTCLKSDGQSTETRIHKTVLKNPSAAVQNGGQETLKEMALQKLIRDGSPKTSETDVNYAYGNKRAKSIDNSPEECEDDSDATLTPGEEDIETRGMRSPGKDRDLQELNTEPKRQTKLRATTEPFIPTNQRQQTQIDEKQTLADGETISNTETAAKQTTAATSNEAIYQTSNMLQRLDSQTVTADVTKQPPLLWYSYQAPPTVDNHPVHQPSHNSVEISQPHQRFQQQRYQLQPHIHNQQIHNPHGMMQEPQSHPLPNFSRCESPANAQGSLPQHHKHQHFNPRAHSQHHYHHHHYQQQQQKTGQGHHIPVHTSSRNPGLNFKHQRNFPQNHYGGSQNHTGNQYRHQTTSLQGQPSNQQPVYNSFWLQFQNNSSNINLPYGVPVNQPRHNIVPNYFPPGHTIRQDVPQRYDVVPQTETVRRPVAPDITSRSAIPTRDGQFIRMQNSYASMNQQFQQGIIERQDMNAAKTGFSTPETQITQTMPAEPHASRINHANSNTNASAFEEEEIGEVDLKSFCEPHEETRGCIIDVLESSRSRENCRALKKSCKKPRPIRSCLVQVV